MMLGILERASGPKPKRVRTSIISDRKRSSIAPEVAAHVALGSEINSDEGGVLELARCEYIERKDNVLALGNSGTGKTHITLALGLAACQKGYRVRFIPAIIRHSAMLHQNRSKFLNALSKPEETLRVSSVERCG